MAVIGNPPAVIGGGEYGATTVHVTKDGSMLRIAFGRRDQMNVKVIYGAVLLSPEAAEELISQLSTLSNAQ